MTNSDAIIKVEGLGKKYIISHEKTAGSYTSLRDVISSKAKAVIRKKEHLPLKEEFWALKDVNFEIKKGEAVGIIGRNGAGKSTLLKILSRITEPSTGRIELNGRVASLLEVGTGFHPELTGRENIFLNGAILGMSRAEIKRKFDEIVDFSGVEKFLDTPVKRYSSGMYVRLAFAVAAHMEPEILIVDEVLAVGDIEFQKKCLGKMGEVSTKEGRTILFVSHNIGAIKKLCVKGIFLNKGEVSFVGSINDAIHKYYTYGISNNREDRDKLSIQKRGAFIDWFIKGTEDFSLVSKSVSTFCFLFHNKEAIKNAELGFVLRNEEGDIILSSNSRDNNGNFINIPKGVNKFSFTSRVPLKHGNYEVDIILVSEGKIIDQWIPDTKLIIKSDFSTVLDEKWLGIVNEDIDFQFNKND